MSRIVLANGCFDLLHYGHLQHLQAARRFGDVLVVSITKDAYVNKGPGRPVFADWQRRAMVSALSCVDRTILVADAMEALEVIQPQVFVKGSDYVGKIEPEHEAYCKAHNIEIVFTNAPHFSSTKLLHYYDQSRQS